MFHVPHHGARNTPGYLITYEEEDTCMSYEEENTPGCLHQSQGDHCIPAATASSGWGERADISHIVKIDLLSVKTDLLHMRLVKAPHCILPRPI